MGDLLVIWNQGYLCYFCNSLVCIHNSTLKVTSIFCIRTCWTFYVTIMYTKNNKIELFKTMDGLKLIQLLLHSILEIHLFSALLIKNVILDKRGGTVTRKRVLSKYMQRHHNESHFSAAAHRSHHWNIPFVCVW